MIDVMNSKLIKSVGSSKWVLLWVKFNLSIIFTTFFNWNYVFSLFSLPESYFVFFCFSSFGLCEKHFDVQPIGIHTHCVDNCIDYYKNWMQNYKSILYSFFGRRELQKWIRLSSVCIAWLWISNLLVALLFWMLEDAKKTLPKYHQNYCRVSICVSYHLLLFLAHSCCCLHFYVPLVLRTVCVCVQLTIRACLGEREKIQRACIISYHRLLRLSMWTIKISNVIEFLNLGV